MSKNTEYNLTGSRKEMQELIMYGNLDDIKDKIEAIKAECEKDLKKYYPGQKNMHEKFRSIFAGRIVYNTRSKQFGLVCRIGFSDDTTHNVYLKVLILDRFIHTNGRETTWGSFSNLELVNIDSATFIQYRYL